MLKSKLIFFFNILMAVSYSNSISITVIPGENTIIKDNGSLNSESINNTKYNETLKRIIDDMSNTTGYTKTIYKFVYGKRKPFQLADEYQSFSSIRDDENKRIIDLTRKIGENSNQNISYYIYTPQIQRKLNITTIRDNMLSQSENVTSNYNIFKGRDNSLQYDNKNVDSLNLSDPENEIALIKEDKSFFSNKQSQQNITKPLNNETKSSEIYKYIFSIINNDNLNQNNSNNADERNVTVSITTKYKNTDGESFLKVDNDMQKESSVELLLSKAKTNNTNVSNEEINSSISKDNETLKRITGPNRIDLNNSMINFDVTNDYIQNDNLKVIPLKEESYNDNVVDISTEKYLNVSKEEKTNEVVFGVISASGSKSSIPRGYILSETNGGQELYQNNIGKLPINQNIPDYLYKSNNSEDNMRTNRSKDQMNTIINNIMKSQDTYEMKKIEKSFHACISEHCTDTEIDYNQNKYPILFKKICEAARQNIIDFWKILAKYLGLQKGHKEDLLEAEKLYVIFTVFTQLRQAIEFGYPIEKTVDQIVKLLQPSHLPNKNNPKGTESISYVKPKIQSNDMRDNYYEAITYNDYTQRPNNMFENLNNDNLNSNSIPKRHIWHSISNSLTTSKTKPINIAISIRDQATKNSKNKTNSYKSMAPYLRTYQKLPETYPIPSTSIREPPFQYFEDPNFDSKQLPIKNNIPQDVFVPVPKSETDVSYLNPKKKVDFYHNKVKQITIGDIKSTNVDDVKNTYRHPIFIEKYQELLNNEKHDVNNKGFSIYGQPNENYPDYYSSYLMSPFHNRYNRMNQNYMSNNNANLQVNYKENQLRKKNKIPERMYAMLIEEISEINKKPDQIQKYPKKNVGNLFLETSLPHQKAKFELNGNKHKYIEHLGIASDSQTSMNEKLYNFYYKPQHASQYASVQKNSNNDSTKLIKEIWILLKQHYVPENVIKDVILKMYKFQTEEKRNSPCKMELLKR